MSPTNDIDRIEQLISARHPCVTITTQEEADALKVLGEVAVRRNVDYWIWSATAGLRDGLLDNSAAVANTEHPAAALFWLTQNVSTRVLVVLVDVAGHLKDERTLRSLRDAVAKIGKLNGTIILLDHRDDFPQVVRSVATTFELSLPNEAEIEETLKAALREVNSQQRIVVDLNREALKTMVRTLRGLTRRQIRQMVIDSVADDSRFDETDLQRFVANKRRALGSGLLEFIEAPTSLDEIGGLGNFKRWLKLRSGAFSDAAKNFGLSAPRGVLMLGVQGAGKSLSAKAVATAWQRPLLRMDVGALYDRYIGESERRLRDALREAERMAPVVLWIDEIEKAFASAASQSTDGGLSKRMFGSLLTWMQEHKHPVFLFATANDIEALPPELLRKGRFDEIFFVDLPKPETRKQILAIHLKKRNKDSKDYDLDALASACDGFSGAEIEQAIVAGLYTAFDERSELSTKHVLDAIRTSPPLSVTMREKMNWLRSWAKDRCVGAE